MGSELQSCLFPTLAFPVCVHAFVIAVAFYIIQLWSWEQRKQLTSALVLKKLVNNPAQRQQKFTKNILVNSCVFSEFFILFQPLQPTTGPVRQLVSQQPCFPISLFIFCSGENQKDLLPNLLSWAGISPLNKSPTLQPPNGLLSPTTK